MRKITFYISIICIIGLGSCTSYTTDKEIRTSIEKDIAYLADDKLEGRAIGTEGEQLAAEYIAAAFKKYGLEPKGTDGYMQPFNVKKATNPHEEAVIGDAEGGITGRNVVGYIDNGAENTVVIGAHFDHLGYGEEGSLYRGDKAIHNGADDNASGTAAMIQLARILKNKGKDKNYLFMAFSGEENGLWGSNYFSKNSTIDLGSVDYMINIDMVGRMNEEKTLAINGVGTSPVWMDKIEAANTDTLKLVTSESGIGPSDHTSFYLQDLPVLHFFTGQHEDYHRPSDDANKINYHGIVKVVRLIERLVLSLDQEEKIAFTKTKDESGDSPRFTVSLGVVPDYLYDGQGMRIDGVSEDKPAQKAGMQKGDIVMKLGDSTIVDMMSYMRALAAFQLGDETKVEFKRGEELKTVDIKF
ncbi:PDZ domain-containing protein [Roseivirga ehrenbergii]|uniref:Peptidase M28 n=1 Tax=Roseivirga ehrenbergii (strain DSM 102268 / JCM 13514 / KCTC 12282 / NCIMB 14502 / KMM 6017) TaxID=279360 RepID=A0A150XN75_ROSEK|nr:M20/M25/M40 family metallo-hydrolase [Roseivirga ehrenbergii]KYG80198.1 peptidase M28 [Roseivirga ehrenbergii]TCK99229.1 PDZ domain-containing protein [Roseivirga ehrenbergii]